MKKNRIVKAALVLAAAMVFMTGCGNSKKAETTVETTAAKSAEELVDEASIKIGQYKGLSISREKAEVTDAEIEAELNYLASLYPVQVTGRPAKLGDVANIDYAGYKDGVAFAGGTAEGYNLTLGSGQFIDGFEDGVVGMEIGEERDLNLTFPEAYHSEELAGADVVFHVTLNSLSSADEVAIDDALAKKVMGDDEATLELLKADIRNDLMIQAESEYYSYGGAELISQSFASVFGTQIGALVVAVAISLFALTTILSWSLYGSRCCEFILGTKVVPIYQVIFVAVVVVGAALELELVWNIADTLNGFMAIPNLIALLSLSGVVVKLTAEHFSQEKLAD